MVKLPRTLHIEGSGIPKGKHDPSVIQFSKLAGEFLCIEEKVDGTGVSLFFDEKPELQIWHRGSPAISKEFNQLRNWAIGYQNDLFELLGDRYSLFGEWMLHKHTIFYDRLPHFFLESDIYDRQKEIWLSTSARNSLINKHEYILSVPTIASFRPQKLDEITGLVGKSYYQSSNWKDSLYKQCKKDGFSFDTVVQQTDCSGLIEGLYIKHENEEQVLGRYKYVRPAFIETIINSGSHIFDRIPIYNMK